MYVFTDKIELQTLAAAGVFYTLTEVTAGQEELQHLNYKVRRVLP